VSGTRLKERAAGAPPREVAPDAEYESAAVETSVARPGRRGRLVRRLLGLVAALAITAGAGWYAWQHGWIERLAAAVGAAKPAAAKASDTGKATLGYASRRDAAARPSGPIETIAVEVIPCSNVLRLTGTLMADEQSSVASNTSGIVAEVHVDRGSFVRKNDVLVRIDATDARNKLAEGLATLEELKARLGLADDMTDFDPESEPEVQLAEAEADLAKANLDRNQKLFDKKVISAEEFDQTKTEHKLATERHRQALFQIRQAYAVCKTAQVKLAILQKAVDDTTIRAPFDGWVAERLVSVGEQISAGMQATTVVTLVRIDPLRLSLVVPQQDIGSVRPGQTARFRADAFPEREFRAAVRFITPVVASETRSMVVEAIAANPDGALRPGLFVTAELELGEPEATLFVPLSAVEKVNEVAKVLVVRDGAAREQVVALGEQREGRVAILSGLAAGERIVAHPALARDGDPVRP